MNLMCYGTVGYKLSNAAINMQEWAARYEIIKTESGDLKFKYVQIIIVSVSIMAAAFKPRSIGD